MKYKQSAISVFFCLCLSVVWMFFPGHVFAEEISVLTNNNPVSYSIEVASTPAQQQQGLMWRKNMSKNHGMLFIFEKSKPVSMWMKNTYIPLDMLFADTEGIIRYIHENAHPLDETVITCPIPVKYVVELNAGQVQENKIQVGNKIKNIP